MSFQNCIKEFNCKRFFFPVKVINVPIYYRIIIWIIYVCVICATVDGQTSRSNGRAAIARRPNGRSINSQFPATARAEGRLELLIGPLGWQSSPELPPCKHLDPPGVQSSQSWPIPRPRWVAEARAFLNLSRARSIELGFFVTLVMRVCRFLLCCRTMYVFVVGFDWMLDFFWKFWMAYSWKVGFESGICSFSEWMCFWLLNVLDIDYCDGLCAFGLTKTYIDSFFFESWFVLYLQK